MAYSSLETVASDYADLIDLTREIIRRLSLHSRALNRNSSPHLAVSESTIAAMQTHGKDFKYDPSGMLFPVAKDAPFPKWITYDPFSTAVHQQLQFLSNEWHEAAQIPKSLLSPGKAPSGAALGIQLAGITWRVKRIQRDIEALLPEVTTAMGIPLEDIEFADNLSIFKLGDPAAAKVPSTGGDDRTMARNIERVNSGG